jgi:predicted lipoprotein with Yx(FWY)xxD motif
MGRLGGVVVLVAAAAVLSACAAPGAGPTTAPATGAPATGAPATGAPATAAPMAGVTLAVSQSATLGAYVAGEAGMSLYVFKNDTAGKSACSGQCAASWPPLTVASAADAKAGTGVTGAVATITRDDGTLQVTLGGAPLYYFAGDQAAGDTSGQGVGGLWYLASPAGTALAGSAATDKPAATECDNPSCY